MTILAVLLLLFLLALLVRCLYGRFWEKGLSCQVSFRDPYGVEGQSSALLEVLVNDKLLPLPVVEIDFHMDKRLLFGDGQNASVSDQSYRRDVFALGVRQQITRTLEFKCAGRGYFRISQAGITAQDLFLTQKYLKSQPQNTDFYVLPRPVPTDHIQIPFSRVMGELLSRKKIYDDPFEFAGLREYSRGDPMKYINWKATARAGELLTDLHSSTLSQKVVVLLDMEGQGAHQADFLNEAAVRTACSLCIRLLSVGVELSVYSNGPDVQTSVPMKLEGVSGSRNTLLLQKKFACVQSGNGLEDISDFFPKSQAPGGEHDLLVLVTHSQRPELMAGFSAALGRERGVLVIPYREKHTDLTPLKNVDIVWMEV